MEKATLGGGCFWCTEAIFKRLRGVGEVTSGYTGGEIKDPTYNAVSGGSTGHVEAIQITFDPKIISYKDLLYVFFRTHDPTDAEGQGADKGSQYMSTIFYHDEKQKEEGEKALKEAQKEHSSPIVTKIEKFTNFYKAEDYHQNYYENNKSAGYCRLVIDPKIQKLQEKFGEYLK